MLTAHDATVTTPSAARNAWMLTATSLTVRLGRREILCQIDFAAAPGQLTVIVGPNGSGKTTLMRALTGEVRAEGQVRMNGLEVARTPRWKLAACRAVLAQETVLAFSHTVAEVLQLGLSAAARPSADLPARALAEVGLTGFGPRPYPELSGGERQRVQLARALVQVWGADPALGPAWLLLDEPVSSLDLGHQLMVMRCARRFADQGGGVVAVMHDLNLSAMFADRVVLLRGGRVLAQGTPAEVLTDALLQTAYNCGIRTNVAPAQGPWLLPHAVQAPHGL